MNLVGLIMIGLGIIPLAVGFFLGYQYPLGSPLYLTLTICYLLVASIVTYDLRLLQLKMRGEDFGQLPAWTGIFDWFQWALYCVLAILNWKLAIGIFMLKFVLKVIPVLEIVGGILMYPIKSRF